MTVSGIMTLVRPEQPENTVLPMLVTPSGIAIVRKLVHPTKVPPSKVARRDGIVMALSWLHPLNAPIPMLSTPSGTAILVRLEHPVEVALNFWSDFGGV